MNALDRRRGGADDNEAQAGHLVAGSLNRRDSVYNGQDDDGSKLIAGTLKGQRGKAGGGIGPEETLVAAFTENRNGELWETPYAQSLVSEGGKPGQGYPAARIGSLVRRLTPVECERLQSFPDGWTLTDGPSLAREPSYPHRIDESCPPPDGPRYAAMGDAVTVNVLEWIGRRLLARASRPAERTA